MPTLLLIAQLLSAASLLALLLALVNLRRRATVPGVSYGSLALTPGRLKALWLAFLVGSAIEGSGNDPLFVRTDDTEGAAVEASAGPLRRTSLSMPLPFYRYERERLERDGVLVEEHVLEGVVLPWSFITALLGYYLLVVRWNPESRWARRILEGKKKPNASEG
jgi:hypothetical protein